MMVMAEMPMATLTTQKKVRSLKAQTAVRDWDRVLNRRSIDDHPVFDEERPPGV